MAKIEPLADIGANYASITKINANMAKIEAAIENTVSRDGSAPNSMLADLDMNDKQLINLGPTTLSHHAASKAYVDGLIAGDEAFVLATSELGTGWGNVLTIPVKNILGFYVDAYGATGDGTTDDTTAVQAAYTACRLAGGGQVHFTPAKTYIISQAINMGANTTTYLNGATVKAKNPGWAGTTTGVNSQMFRNYNYSATSLTDSDIYMVGPGTVDFNSVVIVGGGGHCFTCRYVDRCGVKGVYFKSGENGTAFLGCRDAHTEDCVAYNMTNCHFDHWFGSGKATVFKCRAENGSGVYGSQAIQFTGTGTSGENLSSSDCVVNGCTVKGVRALAGTASAIISNANDPDSTAYYFRSSQNIVEDCDLGLVFSGEGGRHISDSDTFINVTGVPVLLQTANSDSPDNCRVQNPTLIDCADSSVAMIVIAGDNHSVTGVKILNTGSVLYNQIAWFSSAASNCLLEILDGADGTTARVQNDGTNCRVLDRFRRYEEGTYTPAVTFGGGSTGITYTTQEGRYTRVGDTVFVTGYVIMTSKGSSTGNARVTVPFAAAATTQPGGGVLPYAANMSGLTSPVTLGMNTGASTLVMRDYGATGSADVDDTNFTNTSAFTFTATYKSVS